uniref:DNA polymerase zeta catalytic subunit n=1 Tax=Panagrolaimus superbus TaxID=310955 RepID=A0A914YDQ6_9BILA
MLQELLETRVMVKTSMKKYKDEVLKRLLNARQLALKLIANVTYGYTAANYSGRMPCAELADAIVSKGREALERAIKMIEDDVNGEYQGSQVIYGDTDSLFILMPGLSKADAFRIGRKIADDVTAVNPYPMKLKFEKVMMPCCLLAKKRYVGMSYEAEEDEEGVFDAKGIETVRRDSCEFVANSMKIILLKIFERNYHGVMTFLRQTVNNIQNIPLHEFIISGDFRGGYAEGAVLPVKKIAEQLERISSFHIPTHGDRIEFIIAEPPPQEKAATVFSCVFRLDRFIEIPELRIHYDYYINRKLLPALARIFQLIPLRVYFFPNNPDSCVGCGFQGNLWCQVCIKEPQALQKLIATSIKCEQTFRNCSKLCRNCINLRPTYYMNIPCYNVDCNVWEQRYQIQRQKIEKKFMGHYYRKTIKHIKLPNIVE